MEVFITKRVAVRPPTKEEREGGSGKIRFASENRP